jgi:hypothetical protein
VTARFWVDVLPDGLASIYLSEEKDLVYRESEWGGYEWWNPAVRRFIVPMTRVDRMGDFQKFIREMAGSCVGKDFVLCVRQGLDNVGIFHRESLPSMRACDLTSEDGSLTLKELQEFHDDLQGHGVLGSASFPTSAPSTAPASAPSSPATPPPNAEPTTMPAITEPVMTNSTAGRP